MDPHPILKFGKRKKLSRRSLATFLSVPYGSFKQIVTGHTGTSFRRASEWESVTGGGVRAIDVMRWQERNR